LSIEPAGYGFDSGSRRVPTAGTLTEGDGMNSLFLLVLLAGHPAADQDPRLKSSYDSMREITWYESAKLGRAERLLDEKRDTSLRLAESYSISWDDTLVSTFFGYFHEERKLGPLWLRARYSGSRWLMIEYIMIKVDDTKAVTFRPKERPSRQIRTAYWLDETLDIRLDDKELRQLCGSGLGTAQTVVVRFVGDHALDVKLPPEQLLALSDGCGAYLDVASAGQNKQPKK
jgi:hypothetical protein